MRSWTNNIINIYSINFSYVQKSKVVVILSTTFGDFGFLGFAVPAGLVWYNKRVGLGCCCQLAARSPLRGPRSSARGLCVLGRLLWLGILCGCVVAWQPFLYKHCPPPVRQWRQDIGASHPMTNRNLDPVRASCTWSIKEKSVLLLIDFTGKVIWFWPKRPL